MDRLVKDVAELLDHVGCNSVHIAGSSAGGYIAQHLAMAQPQRVKSLALFAAGTGLRHTQATGWLSKVEKEGLRPFLARTISDRFPANADPKFVEWFLDEAEERCVVYCALCWPHDDVGMVRQASSDTVSHVSCVPRGGDDRIAGRL